MNHAKLVRYNLTKPLEARLSHSAISARADYYKLRGLLASIHIQIEPTLRAMRERDALIDSIGSVSAGFYWTGHHEDKKLSAYNTEKTSFPASHGFGVFDGLKTKEINPTSPNWENSDIAYLTGRTGDLI